QLRRQCEYLPPQSPGYWRGAQTGAAVSTMYVATNLTDLHAEPSFLSELLTQVTNGVELTILEERDKWCRVRQTDGYEGWAYRIYLTEEPPLPATHFTHITVTLF